MPLTAEDVFGETAVSPDGRRVALIAHGRLLVIDIDRATSRTVPGTVVDETVCGWHADNASVFVRGLTAPIEIRRVDVAASTCVGTLAPPPLGLRNVCAAVIDHAGDAYAYSFGQELSRLHVMSLSGDSPATRRGLIRDCPAFVIIANRRPQRTQRLSSTCRACARRHATPQPGLMSTRPSAALLASQM